MASYLNDIVREVQVADNYDTPSPNSELSTPRDFSHFKKPPRKHSLFYDKNKIIEHQKQSDYIYFYDRDEIKEIAQSIIDRELGGQHVIQYQFDEEDKQFRKWAFDLRTKYKEARAKECVEEGAVGGKTTVDKASKSIEEDDNNDERKQSIIVGEDDEIRRHNFPKLKTQRVSKLGTYLYGPFSKQRSSDKLTIEENKFGIPNTMLHRYNIENKKRKIKKQALRQARLDHMGLLMPPSGEYSSDESVEEIKTLALIRTPYFVIPKIKTQQKKKADRFKNEYLPRAGLRRITMLLYDRTLAAKKDKTKKKKDEPPRFVIPGERPTMKKIATRVRRALFLRPTKTKQKYVQFIEEQYLRQKKLYDEKYHVSVYFIIVLCT